MDIRLIFIFYVVMGLFISALGSAAFYVGMVDVRDSEYPAVELFLMVGGSIGFLLGIIFAYRGVDKIYVRIKHWR